MRHFVCLGRRDAVLAGIGEVALLTAWPFEPAMGHATSLMNICVLLGLLGIVSAVYDFIMSHRTHPPRSAWAVTASAREACIVGIYFNAQFVGTLACAYFAGYTLWRLRSQDTRPFLLHLSRVVYRVNYAVMLGVLLVQRQGLHVLLPLALSYLPRRREPWAYVVTAHWWWWCYCRGFAPVQPL